MPATTTSSKDEDGRGGGGSSRPTQNSSQEHAGTGELYQGRKEGRSMHSKVVTNAVADESEHTQILDVNMPRNYNMHVNEE